MLASSVPGRITIDFRDSVHPAKAWIIGIGDGPDRVELLAFDGEPELEREAPRPVVRRRVAPEARLRRSVLGATATALAAGCTCPEFCERDHANE